MFSSCCFHFFFFFVFFSFILATTALTVCEEDFNTEDFPMEFNEHNQRIDNRAETSWTKTVIQNYGVSRKYCPFAGLELLLQRNQFLS